MPDVDAFGKTTVSQCGGKRNERSEAIYRTVSRRGGSAAENADCMKDRRFVGLPYQHFQESPRHSSGKRDVHAAERYRKGACNTPMNGPQRAQIYILQ